MLETAPSDVASRFPRNCRASQPVSKPWKLLKISLPPRGGGSYMYSYKGIPEVGGRGGRHSGQPVGVRRCGRDAAGGLYLCAVPAT